MADVAGAPSVVDGVRRTESVMGTTVSLDLRDPMADVDPAAVNAAFAWLHDVDARFSTYRTDSEISRLNRGELHEFDASADVQLVLAECEEMRRRTHGYFDIRPFGPGTPLDPSGYVKGWALEHAAELVARGGARNFCLNGGGDVIARGSPASGSVWRIGIRNPADAATVVAVLGLVDLAVATSGGYERGDHIRDPHSGRAAQGLLSVSVVGPSMTIADVYATAAFAMGANGPAWLAEQPGYEACAITHARRVLTTPGFERLRLRS